ncbi:PIG-L deacetylase family protein [Sphaerobacter thermophilus]|uniref:PIG-L deacetylase family protein n=1 Tax=Sphaerobacter thermophilus TaxID=2057 RepID=UPI000DB1F8EB|nr:MAG: PIG-L family deacetylase [Sphaerobacter thermophilus]
MEQAQEQVERKVAMVFVAHPDDAEFGTAGTVARWAREGWDVYYVIITDGGAGGPDDATDVSPEARRRISETRKAEQRAAGEILGLADVIFLDYPDGQLEPTLELRRDIVRLIRKYRPERVISPSPDRVWEPVYNVRRHHPDHLAAGQAVMAAVYPAPQNPWDFPELLAEGLQPHKVSEIYVIGAPVLNYAVDITETIDLKIAALRAHQSQLGDHFDQIERMVRTWAADRGARHGMAYAEEFHRIINW